MPEESEKKPDNKNTNSNKAADSDDASKSIDLSIKNINVSGKGVEGVNVTRHGNGVIEIKFKAPINPNDQGDALDDGDIENNIIPFPTKKTGDDDDNELTPADRQNKNNIEENKPTKSETPNQQKQKTPDQQKSETPNQQEQKGQTQLPDSTLNPEEQKNIANEMNGDKQKKSFAQRMGDTGRAIKNAPKNTTKGIGNAAKKIGKTAKKAVQTAKNLPTNIKNKTNAIKKGASATGKSVASAIRNPKQFAKNAVAKLGEAALKKKANELQSVKFKKLNLYRKMNKLKKEIKELMDKLKKNYNALEGSLAMWIFSLLFPALHNKIRSLFNFTTNANLHIMVAKLKTQIAGLKTMKITLESATFAFAVLDALDLTIEIVLETWYLVIPIIISPAIFIILLIIFWIFRCGRLSKLTKYILEKISENLPLLAEKLNPAQKALAKQEELTDTTKQFQQTKLLDIGKEKPKNETEEKNTSDKTPNQQETPSPQTENQQSSQSSQETESPQEDEQTLQEAA